MILQCKVTLELSPAIESARRPTVQKRRLSADVIVDAALELIERDGTDALTMRRLGTELGVQGMAIYHHLSSRDDLVHAIADRLLEPLRELDLSDDWREACRRFAATLREIAVARPAAFRLVGLHPFDTPTSLQPVERLLETLVASRFTPADALALYRAVASYARGYALAETTGFTVDAQRADRRRRLETLNRSEFPILAGCADQLAVLDADSGFELGLRALILGLPEPG